MAGLGGWTDSISFQFDFLIIEVAIATACNSNGCAWFFESESPDVGFCDGLAGRDSWRAGPLATN